jgi:2-methylisocitrate lyase-like PEP mutase family enzyme
MLEGGGKTPILSPFQLEELGFKIVAYPLSLLGVSIRAMQVFSLPRSCIVIFS